MNTQIEHRMRRLEDSFLSLVQLNHHLAERCDWLERQLSDKEENGEANRGQRERYEGGRES